MPGFVLGRTSFYPGIPSCSRFVTEYKRSEGFEGQMSSPHLGLWKFEGFQQHIVKVDILAAFNWKRGTQSISRFGRGLGWGHRGS